MSPEIQHEEEINLLVYWGILRKRKKIITSLVGAVVLISMIISLFLPKYYMAEAVIMPSSSGGGGLSSIASQFGGLLGIGGGAPRDPAQQLMVFLESFSLAEMVVKKYDLMPKGSDSMQDAVKDLLGKVKFVNDKMTGTIKIQAEFPDPQTAAKIANGYADTLQDYISTSAFTSAERNKRFVLEQLIKSKRELLESGTALNEFYKGDSSTATKIDVFIGEEEGSSGAADALAQVNGEVTDTAPKKMSKNDLMVKGVSQQVYLQYLTAQRSAIAQLNAMLTQQYEMAKIETVRETLAFQMVDKAQVPEIRSRPKRKQMVMGAFAGSLIAGIFLALSLEYVEKMKLAKKM